VAQHKLTQAFVDRAAVEKGADRTIFWDTALAGFGLMVTASGHRSFVYQYRVGDGRRGSSKRMTMKGTLDLDAARREAKAAIGAVAKGGDPLAERRQTEALAENTFRAVAEEYMKREGKRLRTVAFRRDVLDRLVYPTLGKRQIGEIKRTEIVRLLDKVDAGELTHEGEKIKGGPVMADRTLAVVRKIMNWHASRSDDFRSPIVRGMARTKPNERKRQRSLSDDELRAVWNTAAAWPADTAGATFAALVQFLLLTVTRRNEAARMTCDEISGIDWVIPGERYKIKAGHLVPLSYAAVAVLEKLPVLGKAGYVFTTDGKTPISGFSKAKRAFDKACGVTGWTLHDLRRTGRSLMTRGGVPTDHAERALGHVLSGIRGVYDVYEYRDEKKRALATLAAQLELVLNPMANVVELAAHR